MIHNVDASKLALANFLLKNTTISELNIPELVQMDGTLPPTNFLNGLVLEDTNVSSIDFKNLEQQPYYIGNSYLTNIDLSNLKNIECYNNAIPLLDNLPITFLHNTKLQTLNLPKFQGAREKVPNNNESISASDARYASFWDNYWLRDVSFGQDVKSFHKNSKDQYNGFWFKNNYSLLSLRLYYPYILPANRGLTGLETTPIGNGSGRIFVPDDLVADYKAAQYWTSYSNKIFPLSSYSPTSIGDSIPDNVKTWEEIIADCNSNNILDSNIYSIGSTKTIKLANGIPLQAVIARIQGLNPRIDANDILTDDLTNSAKITWVIKTISIFEPLTNISFYNSNITAPRQYGNTNTTANLRAILNDYYNKLPTVLKNGIKTVQKASYGFEESASFKKSAEKLWPLSSVELGIKDHDPNNEYAAYNYNFDFRLGETNIRTGEIILRDFSGDSANYLDSLVYNTTKNKFELHAAGASNPYLIFGFCT